MKVATAAAALIVVSGAIAGFAVWRSKPSGTRARMDGDRFAGAPDPSDQTVRAVAAPVSPAPVPSPPSRYDVPGPNPPIGRREAPAPAMTEPHLMATLRELGGSAPQRSIDLAREGQRRFPSSADAPERDLIVVQSLVNLKRFHEAQDAARAMVAKYPDNPFARDAERHLLVYPLDQPSREEMQAQMRREEEEQRRRP